MKKKLVLYWCIEKIIVENKIDTIHAAAIVDQLVLDLKDTFSEVNGSARCNIFYRREFYTCMSKKFGWSKDLLIQPVENQSYQNRLTDKITLTKL